MEITTQKSHSCLSLATDSRRKSECVSPPPSKNDKAFPFSRAEHRAFGSSLPCVKFYIAKDAERDHLRGQDWGAGEEQREVVSQWGRLKIDASSTKNFPRWQDLQWRAYVETPTEHHAPCGPQSRHQASIWKIDPGQLGRTTIVRDFVMTIRSLPTSELTPLWSGESRSIGLDYQAWPSTLYSCQGYGSYSIIPNQWDILNTSIAH